MVLETERLLLREWRDPDRDRFAQMNADPEVMRWLPHPLDRATSDALLERIRRHHEQHGWGLWAVERRADGALLGWAGLQRVHDEIPFAPAVEIGWRLARDAWGSGYATEAARAVLEHAFEALGIDAIVSFTAPGNLRSRAVMHRLGMQRDHDGGFLHPALAADDPLAPHVLYRIDRAAHAHLNSIVPERGTYVHDLRHGCSLELRPDAQLDLAVRALARALEQAQLIEPGASTAPRFHPHLTLARATTVGQGAIAAVVGALATGPRVTLDLADTFGNGRIIYLASSEADPMQRARIAALDHLGPSEIDPLVRTRGWTPHLTVAYAVPEHARDAAIALVRDALPLRGAWASVEAWALDERPTRRIHRARLA